MDFPDQIAQIKETQEISSKKISENQKDLQNLAKFLNEQKSFIKKILGQINSISNETELSEAASKTSFKNAIKLYQNKKYDDALVQFSEILKDPKLFKLKKKMTFQESTTTWASFILILKTMKTLKSIFLNYLPSILTVG